MQHGLFLKKRPETMAFINFILLSTTVKQAFIDAHISIKKRQNFKM